MSRERDRLDHLIDLCEAFHERGMVFAVAPLGAITRFAHADAAAMPSVGLEDGNGNANTGITRSIQAPPTRPTVPIATGTFVPTSTSSPRPMAASKRPGPAVNGQADKYQLAWVIPMSSSTEPADLYIERHMLDKVPSKGKGHCALEPFVRLLGKSVKTIREELLAHTSTIRAYKALSGLSEADWADLKRRLVPPGGITDDFLENCGEDYYLTAPHFVLLADLYYLIVPVLSKLGWKHSFTYVPTAEQEGKTLRVVGLIHDGYKHYDEAILNEEEALPPIRTSFWGTGSLDSILRSAFHRTVVHNKKRWFETRAVDGIKGTRICMCWVGPESAVGDVKEVEGRGSRRAPIEVGDAVSEGSAGNLGVSRIKTETGANDASTRKSRNTGNPGAAKDHNAAAARNVGGSNVGGSNVGGSNVGGSNVGASSASASMRKTPAAKRNVGNNKINGKSSTEVAVAQRGVASGSSSSSRPRARPSAAGGTTTGRRLAPGLSSIMDPDEEEDRHSAPNTRFNGRAAADWAEEDGVRSMQALSAIGDDDKYQEEEAVVDVDEEGNPLDADGNVIDNGYYYDDNGVDDYDEEEDADEEGVEEGMVEGGEEGGRKPTLGLGLPDDFFSKAGPTGMTETKGTTRKRMAPEATPTYSTRDGGQKRSFRGSGGGR